MKRAFAYEIEAARDWYRAAQFTMPVIGTTQYLQFAASGLGIVKWAPIKRQFRFSIHNEDMAFVDMSESEAVIGLPSWYFSKESMLKICGDESAVLDDVTMLSIILTNGSSLHEGLHLAYTTDYAIAEFKPIERIALNVIEDLFIEAAPLSKLPPSVSFFVDAKNRLLFDEKDMEALVSEMTDPSKMDLETGVRLATFYKRKDIRDSSVFKLLPSDAYSCIVNATKLAEESTVSVRVALAKRFIKAFPPFEETGASSSDMKRLASEISESETLSRLLGEFIEALMPDVKKAVRTEAEGVEEREEAAAIMTAAIKYSDDEFCIDKMPSGVLEVPTLRELEVHGSTGSLIEEVRSLDFIRHLKQLRTINRVNGEPKTRGNALVNTRLYRIATDGKIFARKEVEHKAKNNVEVIILVDASGSMCTGVSLEAYKIFRRKLSARTVTLYMLVLAVAREITRALISVSIPVGVYAHSGSSGPVLYHIFSKGMMKDTGDFEMRFRKANNINNSENFDGITIAAASRHFTPRIGRKVMFVLSDGRPSGPGYRGDGADSHTKEVVDNLRKQGISIFSISLTNDVTRLNNRIYGAKYNINGTLNLNAEFQRVVLENAGG